MKHYQLSLCSDTIGEPPVLECELAGGDLMDQCRPGSLVTVSGVLRLQPITDMTSKKFKSQSSYSMTLHVNNLGTTTSHSFANTDNLNCGNIGKNEFFKSFLIMINNINKMRVEHYILYSFLL